VGEHVSPKCVNAATKISPDVSGRTPWDPRVDTVITCAVKLLMLTANPVA
jgi:hypothetical protein